MITVKEIAKLAGVSPKTAERALSGVTKDKRRDAKARAELVRKIAAEHGYQPSELALALRRGTTRTIGLLVDILTDQFLAAAVETAMDEAARAGYKIALRVAKFDPEQSAEAFSAFLASGVDGIITSCTSSQLPGQLIQSLCKRNFPLFSLCGQSSYPISSAAPDYRDALFQAVAHLASRGHKKVTLALFKGKEIDNELTRQAFLQSCEKHHVEADYRLHSARKEAESLALERIPALILYGKYSMRVYMDACAGCGVTPDVIGIYNEWTLAGARRFDLAGIIFENAEQTVRTAVQQILREIAGRPRENFKFPARFVPADSFSSLKVADLANQLLFEHEQ